VASSSRMPFAGKRTVVSLVCGLGVVLLVLGLSSGAQAAPKPSIASVTAQLTALGHQNERLAEQYNKAGIDVALKQKQADRAALVAKRAQAAYDTSKGQVRFDLVAQYKGDSLGRTAALLTSRSSQNYLDQLSTLSLISARRATITHQLDAQKTAAAKASTTAAQLLASATKIRKALGVARANLTARVAKYTQLLSRLNAAQRARFLAIKQAKAKAIAQAPVTVAKGKAQVRTVTALGPAPAPSARAAIAVKYALAQIGKPYVFAAAGPRAFDCSGLTMMAWKAAGVSLPHLAAAQFNMGHHIARSQLEPGDLVFFYPGIQHVAMYIGHGLVVHAPHTGDVVRIAPLSEFGGNYMGAIRLP
jgi:cell wall-associated NlpC family hydrolase